MKHIPRIILRDYLLVSLGLFLFVVLLEPFGTRDFLANHEAPYLYYVIEAVFFFLIFLICELFATYVCKLPADYTQPKEYQFKRLACLAVPCILINAVVDGMFFCVLRWGWSGWFYHWIAVDGMFTLRWFLHDLIESISVGAFVIAYYLIVTYNRMQKCQIEELQRLNRMLEEKHNELLTPSTSDQEVEEEAEIVLQGETRESILIKPTDILYIESLANYLNIVFFNGSDLCQKRIRSSLHDIEETLSAYPYIIHIHRAFLVNINYITQISGNTAGYKLQLFGTDKVLPVSKANVAAFKEKIIARKEE